MTPFTAFLLGFLCAAIMLFLLGFPVIARATRRRREIEQMMADRCAKYFCQPKGE